MTDKEFFEKEIRLWKLSPERKAQITGQLYYEGKHDILKRRRTVIGEDGELFGVNNLPDNRVVDNQYCKLVNQKADYLLGRPFVLQGENGDYLKLLKGVFNKRFMKLLLGALKEAVNGGISWFFPVIDEGGIRFRVFPSYEILPFWKDREHTELDAAARVYKIWRYENGSPEITEKAEIYDKSGVHRYVIGKGGELIPDICCGNERGSFSHVGISFGSGKKRGYSWGRVPLIALKYNGGEIPLIKRVKGLQDGINAMLSDFENNMQEDPRNTILVLKNYDGTNLGEFRRNLATYGAVKVRCDGESQGGVDTLEIKVNADNYKAVLELLKRALYENGMGYNADSLMTFGGSLSSPGQMLIKAMFTDIDLDANETETELKVTFEELIRYINAYFLAAGYGDFNGEEVEIIFNRDMLVNESDVIDDCVKSLGILSRETAVAQHPWVNDVEKEIKKLKGEEENGQA